jgi:predicted RNA binding protein YcfA (HicA-like mRNA interferase family)
MTVLPSVTGKELVAALRKAGFDVVRIKGSHHFLRHADGRTTVVPVHVHRALTAQSVVAKHRCTSNGIAQRQGAIKGSTRSRLMRKAKRTSHVAQMRAEYDFDYSKAARGKYYKRLLKDKASRAG